MSDSRTIDRNYSATRGEAEIELHYVDDLANVSHGYISYKEIRMKIRCLMAGGKIKK